MPKIEIIKSQDVANSIIEFRKPQGLFLLEPKINGDKYVAIDNLNGDAWTEEFYDKKYAVLWLLASNGLAPHEIHEEVLNHE